MTTSPVPQPERRSKRVRVWLATLRAAKRLNSWLGAVLNIAGLVGLVASVFTLGKSGSLAQALLAGALGVIALGFAGLAVSLQVRHEKDRIEARGAVALRAAHRPLALAANALSYATRSLLNREDPAVFRTQAHEFARELAEAYSVITNASCRVTVKQTYDDPESGDVAVQTLFSSEPDFAQRNRRRVDLVKDNTDFSELLEKAEGSWLSPDITTMPGYINSHYTREEIAAGTPSYRSVLVWPIRAVAQRPGSTDVDLLGFLCVDSPEVGAFEERRDVSPGEIFSHSLYSSLRLYKQLIQVRDGRRAGDDASGTSSGTNGSALT